MDKLSKKIIIAGAGAIGNYLGVQLHRAGFSVYFLGKDRIVNAVIREGLVFEYPDKHRDSYTPGELLFTSNPACCTGASLVIVTVKCHATETLAQQILPHLSSQTLVLTLQNGISSKNRLQSLLPGHTVLAGMVTFNAVEKSPTHFHLSTHGEIYVEKHNPSLHPIFCRAGLAAQVASPIEPVLWSKLLLNLINPLNALSGKTLKVNLSDRGFRLQWAACMREGLSVLKAAGIKPAKVTPLPPRALPFMVSLPDWIYLRLARNMSDMDENAISSMAQDLAKGRPTEIDFLTGELLRLGQQTGVSTPVNQWVYNQITHSVPRTTPDC